METLKFTCDEFRTLPIPVFEKWYDDNLQTLLAILSQLSADLSGFEYQNGTNRIALLQCRVKSKSSFIDKIYKLIADDNTYKNLLTDKTREYQVIDLVTDLIGARLVMFFDNDIDIPVNYFDVYPMYSIEKVNLYQVIPLASPLFNHRKKTLFKRLASMSDNTNITEKPTAYESLHLIVRYNANYLAIRKAAVSALAKNKDVALEFDSILQNAQKISEFPIEIQIRTILQHTWAQIEHNMNYSETKRKGASAVLDALLLEDFKCHKSMLNAAEHHQTIMYERFWNNKRQSTTLKDEMLGIDERAKYFLPDDAEMLMALTSELHTTPTPDAVTKLLDIAEKCDAKYKEYTLKLTYPQHIDVWGRQRLILLLFAYLLQSKETSVVNAAKNVLSKRLKTSNFTGDKENLVISIYEHIRFIDTYFRWAANTSEKEKIFVSDPLVFYRCAGAYIATHEYRRAIHLLQEVIEHNYFSNHSSGIRDGRILNKLHFMRKIGEYYFLAYIRENQRDRSDLAKSYSILNEALNCTDGPSDPEERKNELRRIVAQMIVTEFHRYVLSEHPNKTAFLEIMKERLSKHFYEYYNIEYDSKSDEAYALQILAIVKFAEGALEEAKQYATESQDLIKKKAANPVFIRSFEMIKEAIKANIGAV